MKRLIILCFTLLYSTALLAEPGMVKLTTTQVNWINNKDIDVGLDPNWHPIEFSNGKTFFGYTSELLDLLEKTIGNGVKFNKTPVNNYETMEELLNKGELDMLSALVRTDDRLNYLRFTDSYISLPVAICARKRLQHDRAFRSLRKQKVAIVAGYALSEILKQDYPEIEFVQTSTVSEAIEAVQSERAEAYVDAYAIIRYHLNQPKYRDLVINRNDVYKIDLRFGVGKENVVLLQIMQKALDHLNQSDFDALENKWLGKELWERTALLIKIAILVILIFSFVFVYSISTRKYR